MNAVSTFGGLFAWLMIFVTHLFFRAKSANLTLAFRMWGYPFVPAFGAVVVASVLATTWFIPVFRSALVYGLPFVAILTAAYAIFLRPRLARAQ
jgi:L-asparagine transporter-like permease